MYTHSDIVSLYLNIFLFSLFLYFRIQYLLISLRECALSFLFRQSHHDLIFSLAAIDLIYSHMIAYSIESSPAAISGKRQILDSLLFYFKRKNLMTSNRSNGSFCMSDRANDCWPLLIMSEVSVRFLFTWAKMFDHRRAQ
jgi:hypothetical protein